MTPEISSQMNSPDIGPAVPAALPAACGIWIIGGGPAGSTAAILRLQQRPGVAEKVRPIRAEPERKTGC